MCCIDAESGSLIWEFIAHGHIESGPIIRDGMVVFAAGDDGVYALDAEDGDIIWHFKDDVHMDCDPTWYEGDVYVGSGPSRTLKRLEVLRLDGKTGDVIWRTPVDLPAWSSPAVDGGRVVVGLGNGRMTTAAKEPAGALLCLNRETGQRLWQNDYPDAVFQKPYIDSDRIIFGCRDGMVRIVSLEDGTLLNQKDFHAPIIAPYTGQLLTLDCTVYDYETPPTIRWRFDIAMKLHVNVIATAAITKFNDHLLVACELIQGPNRSATLFCLKSLR